MHVCIRTLHPRYIVSRYAIHGCVYIIYNYIIYIYISPHFNDTRNSNNINKLTNPAIPSPPSPGAASRSRFSISPSNTRKHLGPQEATGPLQWWKSQKFVQVRQFLGVLYNKTHMYSRCFCIENICIPRVFENWNWQGFWGHRKFILKNGPPLFPSALIQLSKGFRIFSDALRAVQAISPKRTSRVRPEPQRTESHKK